MNEQERPVEELEKSQGEPDDLEMLSDDDLEEVSGGWDDGGGG